MSKYVYGASGRYQFTFFGGETGNIFQMHTRAYRKTESRFLTAQESLDLLYFLQAQEPELVAMLAQEKIAMQPVQAHLLEVEVSA